MAVYKCKMCGGTLEVRPGESVATCDSCGSKQTVPTVSDEVIANLYNRANNLRIKCEFDKAQKIYEQIVEQNDNEAEAHWGIVLCKYGIEYVEDPKHHNRIPTCHRTSFEPIISDIDYIAATDYADSYQQSIYESEARAIDRIQKDILEIVKNEKPFDVFICYKEADENGARTIDSSIANDIYYQLTQEGFKVFYAAITLEDKLGQEYEPYIFAALNSAKVMLVLGTKPEYFTAVWVKNEWSRFMKLMKTDHSKLLIPCFRDMDAYELPEEFARLQAQDMSKIGFINDIVRGIRKVISADKNQAVVNDGITVANSANASISPLLKRAFMFLEDGEFDRADEFCEQVLNIDPECVQAYLGKLMVDLKVRKKDQLQYAAKPFDSNNNYLKILRFGNDEQISELREAISVIKNRNEEARLTGIYDNAVSKMDKAVTEEAYKTAANIFSSIRDFMDADILAGKCIEKAETCRKDAIYSTAKSKMVGDTPETYEKAIVLFEMIPGWKDADEKASLCRRQIEEIRIKEEADKREFEKLISSVELANESIKKIQLQINNEKAKMSSLGVFSFGEKKAINTRIAELQTMMDSEEEKKTNIIKKLPLKYQIIHNASTIEFGNYFQDTKGRDKKPIEWLILTKENSRALLISKKAIDSKRYNAEDEDVTWETCSLRKWLNGKFMSDAFSSKETAMIVTSIVTADKNPDCITDSGKNTRDKIFLLSINEAEKYFTSDESRKCAPTAYAKAQGAFTDNNSKTADGESTCWWWLRSPGHYQSRAALVGLDGSVVYFGLDVFDDIGGVRPALWINLES